MTRIRRNLVTAAVVALIATACANTSGISVETTTPEEAATTSTEVVETTTAQEPSDESVATDQSPETSTTTTTAHQDDGGDSVRTVDIVMTDFAFEPELIEVTAGETIRFVVVNDGAVDHEFRLSNAHRIEEHMASGHEDHDQEGGHHEEDGDVFVVLEPGQTDELTVTFPDDMTVYTETACLLPGHYEAGMKGVISYSDG